MNTVESSQHAAADGTDHSNTGGFDHEDLRRLRALALRRQEQQREVLDFARRGRAVAFLTLEVVETMRLLDKLETRARERMEEEARQVASLDRDLEAPLGTRWVMGPRSDTPRRPASSSPWRSPR